MGVVLLVRHGQASWGAADYDVLSSLGEEQAGLVGSALATAGITPSVVLHGAMVRQRRTAELALAAAGWDCPVVIDGDWDEMDHLELLSLLPASEAGHDPDRRFTAAVERWVTGDHEGDYQESFAAFAARVETALEAVADRVRDSGLAVVFTSGGPIAWSSSRLVEGGAATYRQLARVVVNASVTKVVASERGTTLVSFNDHSHLLGDRITQR